MRSNAASARSVLGDCLIADLVVMEREGLIDAGTVERPDLPNHVLSHPVGFLYAEGFRGRDGTFVGAGRSSWHEATLTVGGMFALCALRHEQAHKAQYGLSLMTLMAGDDRSRKAANAASWTGLALDDDNHVNLGRNTTTKPGGPLRCCFGTASDGKDAGTFSADAYSQWAQRSDAPSLKDATDADAAEFLNDRKDGTPFRGVKVERTPGGLPKLAKVDGKFHVPYSMTPQVRTRTVLLFKTPIEGELLDALQNRRLVKATCKAIAHEVFGATGFDESTMTINAVAYLPTGNSDEFFYQVCGDAYLFDAVGVAERVLAQNPERPKRIYAVPSNQPAEPRGGLHRLALATWLAENAPDLVRAEKEDARGVFVVLHKCPFADSHGTNPGMADGACHVHDADPDGDGFPWVSCKHDTCRGRTTLEYTRQMISSGDLPLNIYKNDEYRVAK